MPKPYFHNNKKIAEIIRVDHAGEFGAKRIYQGQMDFAKSADLRNVIKHMLEQELVHLHFFENEIKNHNVRPTILLPLWSVMGYSMGACSVLLGSKTSMLLTEAVEHVIVGHYQEQIDYLNKVNDSKHLLENIKKFQQEEADHINIALANCSKNATVDHLGLKIIGSVCKLAILLSKRV